uniref:HTH_48 domain-containing protein n=1 Tax=Strongyloides papillosus TaxID=174720 RepID=A0A0N5C0S4_STREA
MALFKLCDSIPDEERSIKFLQEHDLLPSTKICSNGHGMKMVVGKQIRWRCYVKECRKDVGIRVGTWFEGFKLPFRTAILFFYCWSRGLTSIEFCKHELEMNHNTTVDWCNYLREVCLFKEKGHRIKIDGKDVTEDAGETRSMMKEIESEWRRKNKNNAFEALLSDIKLFHCRNSKI